MSSSNQPKPTRSEASVEAVGLIVVAVLLAIMLVLRWGKYIAWGAR